MKAFLLDPRQIRSNAISLERACYEQILTDVGQDAHKQHRQTDNPVEADVILAPIQSGGYGPFFRDLRTSPFFKTYKAKLVCYCPDPLVYPAIPGIYPSAPTHLTRLGWTCGGHYVSSHLHQHHFDPGSSGSSRDLLFSFVGTLQTHPVRKEIFQLRHPRAMLLDSSPKANAEQWWWQQDPITVQAKFTQFRQNLLRTKFSLCPRGMAPSSIRLFESLEAGCVPIIVADDLVLPEGPNWSSFCLRVPERQVASIPALAEANEAKFDSMSKLARAAWEDHFSAWSSFHRLVNWGGAIVHRLAGTRRRFLGLAILAGEYVLPRNIRVHLRSLIRRG